LLNGQMLESAAPLRVGDQIQMGYTGTTLRVLEVKLGTSVLTARPRTLLIGGALAAIAIVLLAVVVVIAVRKPQKSDESTIADSTQPPAISRPPELSKRTEAVEPATAAIVKPPVAPAIVKEKRGE